MNERIGGVLLGLGLWIAASGSASSTDDTAARVREIIEDAAAVETWNRRRTAIPRTPRESRIPKVSSVAEALRQLDPEEAASALVTLLREENPLIQRMALEGLASLGPPAAEVGVPAVIAFAEEHPLESWHVEARHALAGLLEPGHASDLRWLPELADEAERVIAWLPVDGLDHYSSERALQSAVVVALPRLRHVLREGSLEERVRALEQLRQAGAWASGAIVDVAALASRPAAPEQRQAALRCLASLARGCVEPWEPCSADLGRLVVPALIDALDSSDRKVAEQAATELRGLLGRRRLKERLSEELLEAMVPGNPLRPDVATRVRLVGSAFENLGSPQALRRWTSRLLDADESSEVRSAVLEGLSERSPKPDRACEWTADWRTLMSQLFELAQGADESEAKPAVEALVGVLRQAQRERQDCLRASRVMDELPLPEGMTALALGGSDVESQRLLQELARFDLPTLFEALRTGGEETQERVIKVLRYVEPEQRGVVVERLVDHVESDVSDRLKLVGLRCVATNLELGNQLIHARKKAWRPLELPSELLRRVQRLTLELDRSAPPGLRAVSEELKRHLRHFEGQALEPMDDAEQARQFLRAGWESWKQSEQPAPDSWLRLDELKRLDPVAVGPVLLEALAGEDAVLQGLALQALGRIGPAIAESAVPAVLEFDLAHGEVWDDHVARALRGLIDFASLPDGKGPSSEARAALAQRVALEYRGAGRFRNSVLSRAARHARAGLRKVVTSGDDDDRVAAIEALALLDVDRASAMPEIARALSASSPAVRLAAAKAAPRLWGRCFEPWAACHEVLSDEVVPGLVGLLTSGRPLLSREAVRALAKLPTNATDALRVALRASGLDEEDRAALMFEIARGGSIQHLPLLAEVIEADTSLLVRRTTIESLDLGAPRSCEESAGRARVVSALLDVLEGDAIGLHESARTQLLEVTSKLRFRNPCPHGLPKPTWTRRVVERGVRELEDGRLLRAALEALAPSALQAAQHDDPEVRRLVLEMLAELDFEFPVVEALLVTLESEQVSMLRLGALHALMAQVRARASRSRRWSPAQLSRAKVVLQEVASDEDPVLALLAQDLLKDLERLPTLPSQLRKSRRR
ncbi:MAG: hypothetical protein AAF533_09385 [Acidobacteriota bacterium]